MDGTGEGAAALIVDEQFVQEFQGAEHGGNVSVAEGKGRVQRLWNELCSVATDENILAILPQPFYTSSV